MDIVGNLVHPLKSIRVTEALPDSVGDQDDKLPAHQLGLSVPCTKIGRHKDTQRKCFDRHVLGEANGCYSAAGRDAAFGRGDEKSSRAQLRAKLQNPSS